MNIDLVALGYSGFTWNFGADSFFDELKHFSKTRSPAFKKGVF
jgi:hypothetical protein